VTTTAPATAHLDAHSSLHTALQLHPQVALRPEPFGALAYHYGNRRLVFLKHPDVVAVVRCLGDHPTLSDALRACRVDELRWPSFQKAIASLVDSGVIVRRADRER
jgi:putative mycofactocin binding protein MftB